MKNIIKLTLIFCIAFWSCENEKLGTSELEDASLKAASSSDLFTNTCNVINLDRCDGSQPTSNFWWPSHPTDWNNGYFASNDDHQMTFTEYEEDGTANIKGFTVMGSCVVEVDVWLKDRKDWATFLADGGTFKDEPNDCTGVVKEDLHYYVIDSSRSTITATGGDCLEEGTFAVEQRPDPDNATDGDPSTLHLGALVGPGAGLFDYSDPTAYGLSTWGWLINNDSGNRWIFDFNFNLECIGIGSDCETAFAKGNSDDDSVCFIDDDGYKFKRWGWKIGPLAEGEYTYDVYAGAGQCDISKGELVGTVTVNYSAGNVDVTYNIDEGYELRETHVYAGTAEYPTDKKGKATVAPGQYTIQDNLVEGDEIYVILHAVVCN